MSQMNGNNKTFLPMLASLKMSTIKLPRDSNNRITDMNSTKVTMDTKKALSLRKWIITTIKTTIKTITTRLMVMMTIFTSLGRKTSIIRATLEVINKKIMIH